MSEGLIACPMCDSGNNKVVDSRGRKDRKSIRRRRECQGCGHRFTTHERYADGGFIDDPIEARGQIVDAARSLVELAKFIA